MFDTHPEVAPQLRLGLLHRWMVRRDLPQVLRIESQSFATPWEDFDFVAKLRQPNIIGIVAEHDGLIAGHCVYIAGKHEVFVERLAVAREYRRKGIARTLVDKLQGKLHGNRRRVVMDVRDHNLAGQLFAKACGFRAQGIKPNWFDDGEDSYTMVIERAEPVAC